jgi:hypothetical protein
MEDYVQQLNANCALLKQNTAQSQQVLGSGDQSEIGLLQQIINEKDSYISKLEREICEIRNYNDAPQYDSIQETRANTNAFNTLTQ